MSDTEEKAGELVHVDPSTLDLNLNVRGDAKVDADLVASVREHGVLQPIVAVRTETSLRVRYGQRRTLAAIEAGQATVPVWVVGEESDADAVQVERILGQFDENTRRAGLSTGDRAGVVTDLALLGVKPGQIVKRTRMSKAEVEAAAKVGGSKLASKAADRYDLTLEEAAAIAEFEDDTDAVKALVQAAADGRFEHVVQRMRDDRASAVEKAEVLAAAEAAGFTIVERPDQYGQTDTLPVARLRDAEGNHLDAVEHRTCPGVVAWAEVGWVEVFTDDGSIVPEDYYEADDDGDEDPDGEEPDDDSPVEGTEQRETRSVRRWRAVQGCTGWAEHGHTDAWHVIPPTSTAGTSSPAVTPEEAEAAAAAEKEEKRLERRAVIENHKAWPSAETVRREWLTRFAARKTPPKDAGAFLARVLTEHPDVLAQTGHEGQFLAHELLAVSKTAGKASGWADAVGKATPPRALQMALIVALACCEKHLTHDSWRWPHAVDKAYLGFLSGCGYALSDVEALVLATDTSHRY